MLPIVLFYRNSSWKPKQYIPVIIIVYVVWYLTYALLHEICHLVSAIIQGLKVYKYQLIPYFWKGEFGKGYVESEYNIYTVIMPYVKDVVFSGIGFILVIKRVKIENIFLSGIVFTLLIFSPFFDVINNYSIYILYSINDFSVLNDLSNRTFTNSIGCIFLLITFINTTYMLWKTQNYPIENK
jgi:hypothetical protein